MASPGPSHSTSTSWVSLSLPGGHTRSGSRRPPRSTAKTGVSRTTRRSRPVASWSARRCGSRSTRSSCPSSDRRAPNARLYGAGFWGTMTPMATGEHHVRLAVGADLEAMRISLVDAFMNDPVASWIYPDDAQRRKGLTEWYELTLLACLCADHTYT